MGDSELGVIAVSWAHGQSNFLGVAARNTGTADVPTCTGSCSESPLPKLGDSVDLPKLGLSLSLFQMLVSSKNGALPSARIAAVQM